MDVNIAERRKEYTSRYRIKNREKLRLKALAVRRKCRREILEKYGGKCICCGEQQIEFLAIDHIYGGGKIDRGEGTGMKFYLQLQRQPRRDDLQLLCHNCNLAKGFYGACPHKNREKHV